MDHRGTPSIIMKELKDFSSFSGLISFISIYHVSKKMASILECFFSAQQH